MLMSSVIQIAFHLIQSLLDAWPSIARYRRHHLPMDEMNGQHLDYRSLIARRN
jgi:hypothetical protein